MQLHRPKFLVCYRTFSDSSANEKTKYTRRKDLGFTFVLYFAK